jgi:hypothetical protein
MKWPWDVIVWWEIRRVPFNLFLLFLGLVSVAVVMFAGEHHFGPNADFGNPFFGVVLYALAANVCYTLGWVTELIWFRGDSVRSEKIRPKIFRAGVIFSGVLTLLPALVVPVLWAIEGTR